MKPSSILSMVVTTFRICEISQKYKKVTRLYHFNELESTAYDLFHTIYATFITLPRKHKSDADSFNTFVMLNTFELFIISYRDTNCIYILKCY